MVDDAQWLDRASAQALAFVGRRRLADRVLLVFAAREPGVEFRGLPELAVEGLTDATPRLLDSVVRGRWTSGCATASSPRPAATRWRCWSCRAG